MSEMGTLVRQQPEEAKARIMAALTAAAGEIPPAAASFFVAESTLLRWIHRLDLEDAVLALRGVAPVESSGDGSHRDQGGIDRKKFLRPRREGYQQTIVLDEASMELLTKLEPMLGHTRSGVIKTAIRELARKEGLLGKNGT